MVQALYAERMKPWLLILLGCIVFNSAAESLEPRAYQLNEKAIALYTKKIRWELNRNLWLRRVAYMSITAGAGYFMYAWYKHRTAVQPVPQQHVMPVVQFRPEQMQDVWIFAQQQLQQARAEQDAYTSITGWLKMNINASIQQVGAAFIVELLKGTFKPVNDIFVLADSLLEQFFVTVFHSGNIAWFMQHRTRMNDLWREMEKHAQGFDEMLLQRAEDRNTLTRHFHYQSLLATWSIMLTHVTQIIAFMRVKTEWRMKESMIIGEQLRMFTDHLIDIINACWVDLEHALTHQEAVVPIINRTHLAYDKVLEGFALFEKVKDH